MIPEITPRTGSRSDVRSSPLPCARSLLIARRLLRNFCSAHRAIRSRHRGVSWPVAGADMSRLTPDARSTVSLTEEDTFPHQQLARRTPRQSTFLLLQHASELVILQLEELLCLLCGQVADDWKLEPLVVMGLVLACLSSKKTPLQFCVHNRALASHP